MLELLISNYTVNYKNVHPFEFYNKFVKCSAQCDNIWQKYTFINIVYGGIKIACPIL